MKTQRTMTNPLGLRRCAYGSLNPRQQEAFNYQKVSGLLADYGYLTLRLSDDWRGADFIAQHVSGGHFLKIQLKGRLTFNRKYRGRDLMLCFPDPHRTSRAWYLYPHDLALDQVLDAGLMRGTKSWDQAGHYHFPALSVKLRELLAPYRLEACE